MNNKIRVATGFSIEKDPAKAIKEAVGQIKTSLKQEIPSLAFVFTSIEFANPIIAKNIYNSLGNIPTIGCSGAGIISNQGIFKRGIIILCVVLPSTISFNTALTREIRTKTTLSSGEELGEKLLRGFKGIRRDLGIFFLDGMLTDSSNFIFGLQERLGTSFPLIGASSSDNLKFFQSFINFNDESISDAASGVIFGGKINFGWGINHGWKPLGKPRFVTKAENNIIYEIDNYPAAKVYEEYMALNLNELKKQLKRISTFYPIGLNLQGEEEYLLRNIHSIGDDGSLIVQGNIPTNSLVRLMIGTKESCLQATSLALNEAKKNLYGKDISFLLIFDSASRSILLGRDAYKEIEIINKELENPVPIAGVYTFGEHAPLSAMNYYGKTYFHNQTITILGVEG